MCDCIERLREEVLKEQDAVSVEFESFVGSYNFGYTWITKSKTISSYKHHASKPWNFCPICGKPWKGA